MKKILQAFFASAIFLSGIPAIAQVEFPTAAGPTGPKAVGTVNMCVVAGVAAPCGVSSNGFPAASTPVSNNASGTTGAVVATIPATASQTNYLCGFDVSAIGGTDPVGPITVTGLLGGTKTYQLASSASGSLLQRNFAPCIPASAANIAIVVTTTADGTATAVNVNTNGYRQ